VEMGQDVASGAAAEPGARADRPGAGGGLALAVDFWRRVRAVVARAWWCGGRAGRVWWRMGLAAAGPSRAGCGSAWWLARGSQRAALLLVWMQGVELHSEEDDDRWRSEEGDGKNLERAEVPLGATGSTGNDR
jgi:hypothetical protein